MNPEDFPEDIRRHLPQFLSDGEADDLFVELNQFPKNIDERMYTRCLVDDPDVYQGDAIRDLLMVHLPEVVVKPVLSIIVSNTCDISSDNKRHLPVRVLYAPIHNLSKFEMLLRNVNAGSDKRAISDYVDAIRKQRVSNLFYLPAGRGAEYESIARLDMIQNGPLEQLHGAPICERRVISLSQYGFYVFLLKLSIHFTRIRENVKRG